METGVTGLHGLAVLRHVQMGPEAEQETATTQYQLMEAKTVQDQAMSSDFVILILVLQVPSFMFYLSSK